MQDHHVWIEGTILAPSVATCGPECPEQGATSFDIAGATLVALLRTVPPSVPGAYLPCDGGRAGGRARAREHTHHCIGCQESRSSRKIVARRLPQNAWMLSTNFHRKSRGCSRSVSTEHCRWSGDIIITICCYRSHSSFAYRLILLQDSALQAWRGDDENVAAAQVEFAKRTKFNGLASLGKYKVGKHSCGYTLHN